MHISPKDLTAKPSPDLEILVDFSNIDNSITFTLHAGKFGLNYVRHGPKRLKSDPSIYFSDLLKRISPSHTYTSTTPETVAAHERNPMRNLELAGYSLTDSLLPKAVQDTLWNLQGNAKTIQIQSDEPWIPWEIIRLKQKTSSNTTEYGPFLCEAFDVTHWRRGLEIKHFINPRSIAVIAPSKPHLSYVEREVEFLQSLGNSNRKVDRIDADLDSIISAFSKGIYDIIHFSGHARTFQGSDPDSAAICIENYDSLAPLHLSGEAGNLGQRSPLIFFNACHTGQQEFSLTGIGGWAERFLSVGASAFIGTRWAVNDKNSFAFCSAFYSSFLNNQCMSTALRKARETAHTQNGDPTWLAYTAFAHPELSCLELKTTKNKTRPKPTAKPNSPANRPFKPCLEQAQNSNIEQIPQKIINNVWQKNNTSNQTQNDSDREATRTTKPSTPKPTTANPSIHIHPRSEVAFVYIPGGEYLLGDKNSRNYSKPDHIVRLSPFHIGKYSITNKQYARFITDCKHPEPAFWHDPDFNSPNQPVVGVSWNDAQTFCRWAGLELPSEAQWEAAARGTDRRRYPWGNDPPTSRLACFAPESSRPAAIDSYLQGAGPHSTLAWIIHRRCKKIGADHR